MIIRFAIFSIVVIVICLVDFSAIMLDEPSRRILYYDDSESETSQEVKEEAQNAEKSSDTPESGDGAESTQTPEAVDVNDDFEEDFDMVNELINEIHEVGEDEKASL